MSEVAPDITIDVHRWASAKEWTWEEAEYLLVGVDHWKIRHLSRDVPLDLKDDDRRRVREALKFHFRLEDVPERVSPADALEIASRAGIKPPIELASAVAAAVALAQLPEDTSADVSPPGLTRKYNKLLKILLAIAVKRYRYDPSAKRQGAIAQIRQDAEALGFRIDEDTIRKRLLEALDELEAEEEAGLQSHLDSR